VIDVWSSSHRLHKDNIFQFYLAKKGEKGIPPDKCQLITSRNRKKGGKKQQQKGNKSNKLVSCNVENSCVIQ
jgi:hypothetical protein